MYLQASERGVPRMRLEQVSDLGLVVVLFEETSVEPRRLARAHLA